MLDILEKNPSVLHDGYKNNNQSLESTKRQTKNTRDSAYGVAPRLLPETFIDAINGTINLRAVYDVAVAIWQCKALASVRSLAHQQHMYVDSIPEIMQIILQGGMCVDMTTETDDSGGVTHKVFGCMHIEYIGQWHGYPVAKMGGLAVSDARSIKLLNKTFLFPDFRGAVKIFRTWGEPHHPGRRSSAGGLLARGLHTMALAPQYGVPLVAAAWAFDQSLIDIYATRKDGSKKILDERPFAITLPPGVPKELWPQLLIDQPEQYTALIGYLAHQSLSIEEQVYGQEWLANVQRAELLRHDILHYVQAVAGMKVSA